MRNLDSTIAALPKPEIKRLPTPQYKYETGNKVALAVESMKYHMTDEGWQIMQGLGENGYQLCGYRLAVPEVDVSKILELCNPKTVLVQDKREWDIASRDFREPRAKFENVEVLAKRDDIFKLTILKDSHQRPDYHKQSAEEMGVHAWVVYYHPNIVSHLAPYTRPEHLIRTYHSINSDIVPDFQYERRGCLLSGAVSNVYPLRQALISEVRELPDTVYLKHPGYHRNGCATPEFLRTLSHYKVAICTSSIYGYALRKIIEATACGCIVLTDLPTDEVLPYIDENLVRVDPTFPPRRIGRILRELYQGYDPIRQIRLAEAAMNYYDYSAVGRRLSDDIETLRSNYVHGS